MGSHVVMFSGGVGSWAAAKRVAEKHGTKNLTLLFTDTKMEDEDLYRFLTEAAANVGGTLVTISGGRTPWQVFFDVRFLGNSRVDPCSRILKRDLARKWITDRYKPDDVTIYIGIDWTESHRMVAVVRNWEPYTILAPMTDPPYLDKKDMLNELTELGIQPPALYKLGFPHNNCGGFCIKAGHAQFKLLLDVLPEVYCHHERKEEELRQHLGKDVAILRSRIGGKSKPMTLREFREKVTEGYLWDQHEWGGCGCFT